MADPPIKPDRERFGAELRRLRREAGLTQRDLAEKLTEMGAPTTGTSVGLWEKGSWPLPDRMRVLERLLHPPSTLAALAGQGAQTPHDLIERIAELVQRIDYLEARLPPPDEDEQPSGC